MTPAARCPECQRAPRLRILPALVDLARTVAPETKLQTYGCRCGRVYAITAEAVRKAA